jgi:hypothetical protein
VSFDAAVATPLKTVSLLTWLIVPFSSFVAAAFATAAKEFRPVVTPGILASPIKVPPIFPAMALLAPSFPIAATSNDFR